MGLRINTNLGALAAQHQLGKSQQSLDQTMKQLASGDRFAPGSVEGPGDAAVADNLRGQIRGMRAATMNAENASSFMQIAEGGLNEQNNILIRMRELAVQSASDTLSDDERGMVDTEYQQIMSELDRIAQTTQFGSNKLLSGEGKEYEFQVGAYKGDDNVIRYEGDADTTASSLGISGSGVADKSDARDSLQSIDDALMKMGKTRASFGAMQSRLTSVVNNGETQIEGLEAAHSRIADTDYAQAVAEMTKQKALQQYQVSVLAQANQFPQNVLRLL